MIFTVNTQLIFGINAKTEWKAILEMRASSTLDELHLSIQNALNFSNDHLYEFYIADDEINQDRIRFDDEDEKVYTTTLESLVPLLEGNKLFYLFDYGDRWRFKVAINSKKTVFKEKKILYPRVVAEFGCRPVQYPEYESTVEVA